jgi:arsenite methyltransferase
VAGALTERDFVEKLEKAGFGDIEVHHREPMSVDDLTLYPLFTDELIELMRTLIAPERQDAVATAIVLTATRH